MVFQNSCNFHQKHLLTLIINRGWDSIAIIISSIEQMITSIINQIYKHLSQHLLMCVLKLWETGIRRKWNGWWIYPHLVMIWKIVHLNILITLNELDLTSDERGIYPWHAQSRHIQVLDIYKKYYIYKKINKKYKYKI